ncbi:hypothetical protein OPV22_008994 [Ensete ventricosum]|uniref:Uncharacterized protein n=1 Tax=Ensete ventricosum TaxID=4639 RepID=A0AAV8RCC3_ENSVE|nr:hypothetical protein OPV22_008994 [Ensete ventricosum]
MIQSMRIDLRSETLDGIFAAWPWACLHPKMMMMMQLQLLMAKHFDRSEAASSRCFLERYRTGDEKAIRPAKSLQDSL